MEQTFARSEVRDTTSTEDLTEHELLARELDAARTAVARAYSLERMGIGRDQVELKQYYKQLSLHYVHEILRDELATIDDETQRNALAIGSMIEESIRLGEMIDQHTEENMLYRGLRKLDNVLESGSPRWVKVKRFGMSVVAAAAGKMLGGIPGAMLGAAASAGIQEVAKIRYDSVGQPVNEQLGIRTEMSSRTDVDASSLMAEAQYRSLGRVEQNVARDRSMTHERAKVGLKRAGTAAALAGVAGFLMTNFSAPAYAGDAGVYATEPNPGSVAPVGSVEIPPVSALPVGEVVVDGTSLADGNVEIPAVINEPGLLEGLDTYQVSGVVDVSGSDPSVPIGSVEIDSAQSSGAGEVVISPTDTNNGVVEILPADSTAGEVVTQEPDGLSGEVVIDNGNTPVGTVEIPVENNPVGEVVIPGVDAGGSAPDVVEIDGELPSVDKGEGLNEFVKENYDFGLSHEQSMALGEELHESGFMYEDTEHLGEKFGNPYGISLPGEISVDTNEIIQDMVDDGELNDSNVPTVEADVAQTVDNAGEVVIEPTAEVDAAQTVDNAGDVVIEPTAAVDATGIDVAGLYIPDNAVELPVSLGDAQGWIESGQLEKFNTVLDQDRMADLAQYLDQKDVSFGDIDKTEVIATNHLTGAYEFNTAPDGMALPTSVKMALGDYFSKANFALVA